MPAPSPRRVASKRRIKLKADSLAERIGCTMAVRTLLGLTTIGACDLTRAERNEATRSVRTDAERERERRKGVHPREQYRAKAEALRVEAAALGIAYETLRKRKRRALSQVAVTRKRVSAARQALATPASPPRLGLDDAEESGCGVLLLKAHMPRKEKGAG